MKPAGLILAGGLSSRMGGQDKAFAALGGRPLLAHVVASLQPQVDALLINSNNDPARFAGFGLPVREDCMPGRLGPLAGLLTGMLWARLFLPDATHILSAPCDIPHLPEDIGARLATALSVSRARIALASDDNGLQPTIGLWPIALADRLAADLALGQRGLQAWLQQFTIIRVHHQSLHNINTPDDLHAAAKRGRTAAPPSLETTDPCALP